MWLYAHKLKVKFDDWLINCVENSETRYKLDFLTNMNTWLWLLPSSYEYEINYCQSNYVWIIIDVYLLIDMLDEKCVFTLFIDVLWYGGVMAEYMVECRVEY